MKYIIIGLILIVVQSQLKAQVTTGHYGPGLFGLRSAHGFPMGWSFVNVSHFYYAGEFKDNDGNVSTLSEPVNVIANISGGLWGKKLESINANYNAGLIIPLANLAPNIETLELDPERIGLGDIFIIPAMLTWNFGRITLNTRYTLWLPSGSYSEGSKSNRGKGFWSHNIGLGTTVYLDKASTWHVSAMNTYELNSRQKETNIKPGDVYTLEWGIGKTIEQVFNIGLIGHNVFQLTKQKGGDNATSFKHQLNGVGMEFNYRTQNKWVFITRWYLEYLAKNRPEGTMIRFIFLKNF